MTTTLRDVLTARIDFPRFAERLACEPEALGLVRLREFSGVLPLAPGDLLAVDDEGIVTGVEDLAEGWLVQVHFHLAVDPEAIPSIVDSWEEAATAVQVGPPDLPLEQRILMRNAFILSSNREWLNDAVEGNGTVEFVDVLREPGMPVIFDPEGATDRW